MIQDVVVKPLRIIPDDRGYLMEMLRCDDPFFERFGESYLTAANPAVVKGWHYHKVQVDHFVCVSGLAKVVLYDRREDSPTRGELQEFFMGQLNPILLRIPPGAARVHRRRARPGADHQLPKRPLRLPEPGRVPRRLELARGTLRLGDSKRLARTPSERRPRARTLHERGQVPRESRR